VSQQLSLSGEVRPQIKSDLHHAFAAAVLCVPMFEDLLSLAMLAASASI